MAKVSLWRWKLTHADQFIFEQEAEHVLALFGYPLQKLNNYFVSRFIMFYYVRW